MSQTEKLRQIFVFTLAVSKLNSKVDLFSLAQTIFNSHCHICHTQNAELNGLNKNSSLLAIRKVIKIMYSSIIQKWEGIRDQ